MSEIKWSWYWLNRFETTWLFSRTDSGRCSSIGTLSRSIPWRGNLKPYVGGLLPKFCLRSPPTSGTFCLFNSWIILLNCPFKSLLIEHLKSVSYISLVKTIKSTGNRNTWSWSYYCKYMCGLWPVGIDNWGERVCRKWNNLLATYYLFTRFDYRYLLLLFRTSCSVYYCRGHGINCRRTGNAHGRINK